MAGAAGKSITHLPASLTASQLSPRPTMARPHETIPIRWGSLLTSLYRAVGVGAAIGASWRGRFVVACLKGGGLIATSNMLALALLERLPAINGGKRIAIRPGWCSVANAPVIRYEDAE
jgi:hypothetical protein